MWLNRKVWGRRAGGGGCIVSGIAGKLGEGKGGRKLLPPWGLLSVSVVRPKDLRRVDAGLCSRNREDYLKRKHTMPSVYLICLYNFPLKLPACTVRRLISISRGQMLIVIIIGTIIIA